MTLSSRLVAASQCRSVRLSLPCLVLLMPSVTLRNLMCTHFLAGLRSGPMSWYVVPYCRGLCFV
jgi:hypothetical protein